MEISKKTFVNKIGAFIKATLQTPLQAGLPILKFKSDMELFIINF